jgi:hypothetical protein
MNQYKANRRFMGDYRHDRINELQMKSRQSLAIDLANLEPKLVKAHEDLDLAYYAIGEIYGEDGLEKIRRRVDEAKKKANRRG